MKYHIIAFLAGFILDLILGDPYVLPHPIRLIGTLIGRLDEKWNTSDAKKALNNGRMLVLTVTGLTTIVTAAVLMTAYIIHPVAGVIIESIMTYQILATKCLKVESMKVYRCLKNSDTKGARQAVSMIVGRDTETLDEIGIAKAAIETVAENTSDGVIAPMIYLAIGGPILGFLYKSINTMDSMVGYKNEKYQNFGRSAALLDDVVNYLPSRISAYLMMAGCVFLGNRYSLINAYKIHKRDSRKHASPNSAQTESTCAGALGIQLAGNASYFGKIHVKPFIGDKNKEVEFEDIRRANNLLYITAVLCECCCIMLMSLFL